MFVRRAMSRRILGVGIVLGGLIVLAIGLIIGIGFPKFVYETNLKAVCIQDAAHPRYKLWVTMYLFYPGASTSIKDYAQSVLHFKCFVTLKCTKLIFGQGSTLDSAGCTITMRRPI